MTDKERRSSVDEVYATSGVLEVDSQVSKRPNKRGELTREKIITAAIGCFSEYGYNRTRVADITHRAKTAQGNFYRHFSNLDEVFLAALKPSLEELAEASRRRGMGDDDLESLISVSTGYLQAYARHRSTLRLLREAAAASANDGFLRLWLSIRDDFVVRTRRWLERLAEQGRISNDTDFELLAESLGCLTEQMAYVHVGLTPSTPRPERIEDLGRALGEVWHRALPRPQQGPA